HRRKAPNGVHRWSRSEYRAPGPILGGLRQRSFSGPLLDLYVVQQKFLRTIVQLAREFLLIPCGRDLHQLQRAVRGSLLQHAPDQKACGLESSYHSYRRMSLRSTLLILPTLALMREGVKST